MRAEPNAAEWCCDAADDEAFSCPLLPMTVRHRLLEVVGELESLGRELPSKAFEEGIGDG